MKTAINDEYEAVFSAYRLRTLSPNQSSPLQPVLHWLAGHARDTATAS